LAAPPPVPLAHTTPCADNKPQAPVKENMAFTTRCKTWLIADRLAQTNSRPKHDRSPLRDEQRTRHLPELLDDMVARLRTFALPTKDGDTSNSLVAVEHGRLRRTHNYIPGMLTHELRFFQVAIGVTSYNNISVLKSNCLLLDVMTIAKEVRRAVNPDRGELYKCPAQLGEAAALETEVIPA
jgi:hypothetical protein